MSDNLADSLRRELETEIRHAIFDPNATTRRNVEEALYAWQARAVLAVVEPLLEAARADEREKIAKAVENDPHNGWVQSITDSGSHSRQRTPKEWAEFVRAVSDGD